MATKLEKEIELERRKSLQDEIITEHKKNQFILEIKNGLGKEILEEPNKKIKKIGFFGKIKKVFGWN